MEALDGRRVEWTKTAIFGKVSDMSLDDGRLRIVVKPIDD